MTGKRKYQDDVVPFLNKAVVIELTAADVELVREFAKQFQKLNRLNTFIKLMMNKKLNVT